MGDSIMIKFFLQLLLFDCCRFFIWLLLLLITDVVVVDVVVVAVVDGVVIVVVDVVRLGTRKSAFSFAAPFAFSAISLWVCFSPSSRDSTSVRMFCERRTATRKSEWWVRKGGGTDTVAH